MCKINKDSLYDEINNFKNIRDEQLKPIQERFQVYIDNTIFQELPFYCGDILKNELNNEVRYFIYKGIRKEYMDLYGCDENGVENNNNRQYHWSAYDDFEIYKEIE